MTEVYEEAFKQDEALSKNQLYECDHYALIKTFEVAISKVEPLLELGNYTGNKLYYV